VTRLAPAVRRVLGLVLLAAVAGAAPVTLEHWREGDHAVLEQVLAETRAQTEEPGPPWYEYLAVLAMAGARGLADLLKPMFSLLGVSPDMLKAGAWLVLAGVVILLVVLAVHLLLQWRRPARTRDAAPEAHVAAATAAALLPDQWALELERRLAAGDPRGALEALWWWWARTLTGSAALPSWTTRELLLEARRPDLAREGHLLDRLLYAGGAPETSDVRRLAARLREAAA
jgi:hypothetical protein